MNMNKWTETEVIELKKKWNSSSKQEMLDYFGRTWKSIQRKADTLKLSRQRQLYSGAKLFNDLPSWLEGEMLGDGHIDKNGRYAHTTKYEDYALFLKRKFQDISIDLKVYKHITFDKRTEKNYTRYIVRTPSVFKIPRQIWYPLGYKIVPIQKIDDQSFAHWIMGDGSVRHDGTNFRIATMGFDLEELNTILSLLQKYGLACAIGKDKNISVKKTHQNKNRIKAFLSNDLSWAKCYEYKLDRITHWVK